MKRDKLIFGSTAVKHWFPDFREPNDLDYIDKNQELITKEEQRYWIPTFQYFLDNNKDDVYLDPEFILVNKMAHFGWDVHWNKTMNDILFLKSKGVKADPAIYRKLVKDWIKVHGKKWASLKDADSKSFFEDAVNRKYVHDSIHEAVAVEEEPMYFKILKSDDGSVGCSKEKFEELTLEQKLNLVREETWVTALERYLIPNDYKYSVNRAYFQSIKKLTTTMSSGWFKEWIIFNFDLLYKTNTLEFVDKFKQKVKQGKVEEYE
jgi:hypothetical protein